MTIFPGDRTAGLLELTTENDREDSGSPSRIIKHTRTKIKFMEPESCVMVERKPYSNEPRSGAVFESHGISTKTAECAAVEITPDGLSVNGVIQRDG